MYTYFSKIIILRNQVKYNNEKTNIDNMHLHRRITLVF